MRRYYFQINGEHGTDGNSAGITLSSHSAAMLQAVTMCGELGCGSGFLHDFAVTVCDEQGAAIGRVSVVVATSALGAADA